MNEWMKEDFIISKCNTEEISTWTLIGIWHLQEPIIGFISERVDLWNLSRAQYWCRDYNHAHFLNNPLTPPLMSGLEALLGVAPPSSLLPAFAPANIKEAEFHNGDVLEHFGTVLGKGLCHVAPIIQLKLAIALENYLDFFFFASST